MSTKTLYCGVAASAACFIQTSPFLVLERNSSPSIISFVRKKSIPRNAQKGGPDIPVCAAFGSSSRKQSRRDPAD